MENKIANIIKILKQKYKFGPLTAKNLAEGNLNIVELPVLSDEEIAGKLNEIYEQEDDDE